MKRAAVPSILVVMMLLVVAAIAEAQQPGKVAKLGWLGGRSPGGPGGGGGGFGVRWLLSDTSKANRLPSSIATPRMNWSAYLLWLGTRAAQRRRNYRTNNG